ncbi:MAG TPA: nucleotidyltransferase family protein [Candidatus Altiarchaeales archaeon]|nr:nucleotidyltransferase family protein [Candidatus Altiarchaeales archaeon]
MLAIILAGGLGTRLRPLTFRIPKALLPLHGKPILASILESLDRAGIDKFNIVVGPMGKKIISYFESTKYRIEYSWQKEPLGTADALRYAELPDSDFLVSASDCLFSVDYLKEFLEFHSTGEITLALKTMSRNEIISSSTVEMDDGRVRRIIEKPSENEILSLVACAPLYIFPPESKEYIFKVEKSKRGEYEIAQVIQNMLDDGFIARGLLTEKWEHLSTLDDFRKLNPTKI